MRISDGSSDVCSSDLNGQDKACFGVTEPGAGLNTTQIKTRAIKKGDRYIVDGQKVWISTAKVANKIMLLARTTTPAAVKKIGRAPCRERVCQYVYILVVHY